MMMNALKLGAADTIFEEEAEDLLSSSANSPLLSPPYSSPSSPDLLCSVEAWSHAKGKRPDVRIHVQGACFCLHKEALTSKSGYLKRHLLESSELVLSPPLKVTVDAFKLFAEFCYQCDVAVTSFNVASLRTAVDLLDLTDDVLRQKAESYFSLVVAASRDLSAAVFLSALSLLPESEDLAFLPSRCLEAICSLEGPDGDVVGVRGCADCVKAVSPADFQVIVGSMQRRLTLSHDLLYSIVDLYLQVYEGKISEEEKIPICNSIDCNMLSPQLLIHAVQNPRMSLRFIVQAMLVEQVNTRRSIISNVSSSDASRRCNLISDHNTGNFSMESTALNALLQRDAALQQVNQLREAMDTTTSRIRSLEKELSSMKLRLIESEKRGIGDGAGNLYRKSLSCRYSDKDSNKLQTGERGSASCSNLCFRASLDKDENREPKGKKNFGQRLLRGLKSAFRGSSGKKDLAEDEKRLVQGD